MYFPLQLKRVGRMAYSEEGGKWGAPLTGYAQKMDKYWKIGRTDPTLPAPGGGDHERHSLSEQR